MKWLVWASLLPALCGAVHADERAQQVVIVYNENEPESRPLAEYYAQKRGVPTNQICAIRAPTTETITRKEYNEQLRQPIEQFLTDRWLFGRVSYIVLMYGVPLRIDRDPNLKETPRPANLPEALRRNEASVDTELAVLPTPATLAIGPLHNPFFGNDAPVFGEPLNRTMLLVGRLDGPDAATVRRMIDDALAAERYGLQGRAYFDIQSTTDKGYVVGDDWIRGAYRLFRDAGYECELDERPGIYEQDDPVTDVAVYAGWYASHVAGPFKRETFRFKPGAVAYHLHSASGASVRSRTTYWVGPLLDKGAAASMGCVFEPYLSFTPHIDMFFKRLLDGATFLEAGYYSQPALSWQTTFVGDPLYRPFAASLDEQIARLEADNKPDVEWAYVRKVNLLRAAGKADDAEQLCRAKARALGSAVLYERLGDLLRTAHRDADAIAPYTKAAEDRRDAYRHIRGETKLAHTYETMEQFAPALVVYEHLIAEFPGNGNVLEFYKKARDLSARLGQDAKTKALQAKIDEIIAAREKAKKN